MTLSLMPQQRALVRFIKGYQLAHGRSPTFAEIAAGIGYASRGTAHSLASLAEERGALRLGRGRSKEIDVLIEIPVPRAPDGAPLYFVPIGGGR